MTLGDLVTSLRTELKTDPNGKIWSDGTLEDYIREGVLQIQSDGGFSWPANENGEGSVVLQQGVREYNLPDQFGRLEIVQQDTTTIWPIDFVQVRYRNPQNAQAAIPSDYYIRGSKIGFDPVPATGGTVTLFYKKLLTPLTDEASVLALTDDFSGAIVKYAAYLAWSSPRGNADTAASKLSDYMRKLSLLQNTYQLRDLTALNYRTVRNSYNRNYPNRLP